MPETTTVQSWVDALAAQFLLWLPQLGIGIAIVIATAFAARAASGIVGRIEATGRVGPALGGFFQSVARVAIWIIGLVTAAGTLGLQILPVLSGLGIVGLALGLAAQDTIGNLISGVIILWDRPFTVGDVIMIDGTEGTVQSIALRTTRVVAADGVVIIPNRLLTGSRVTNKSLARGAPSGPV